MYVQTSELEYDLSAERVGVAHALGLFFVKIHYQPRGPVVCRYKYKTIKAVERCKKRKYGIPKMRWVDSSWELRRRGTVVQSEMVLGHRMLYVLIVESERRRRAGCM